jgi:organic hydroperoxide reductase OsmC/OhrA
MRISSSVSNAGRNHRATVRTAGQSQELSINAKASGQGSSVNGGELLMLALATCYCNDIYREAARLGLQVDSVEVEAQADFEGIGLAARNISYRARVESAAPEADIDELLRQTDAVAEIQNTVRAGAEISRLPWRVA